MSSFRHLWPCDLLSDARLSHQPTDYADEQLIIPSGHRLDSLTLQLAPSNHHRAAYLHLTRFGMTHTQTHTQRNAHFVGIVNCSRMPVVCSHTHKQ